MKGGQAFLLCVPEPIAQISRKASTTCSSWAISIRTTTMKLTAAMTTRTTILRLMVNEKPNVVGFFQWIPQRLFTWATGDREEK